MTRDRNGKQIACKVLETVSSVLYTGPQETWLEGLEKDLYFIALAEYEDVANRAVSQDLSRDAIYTMLCDIRDRFRRIETTMHEMILDGDSHIISYDNYVVNLNYIATAYAITVLENAIHTGFDTYSQYAEAK